MGKRAMENNFHCDIDMADTFISGNHNTEVNKFIDISPSESQMEYWY